MAETGGRESLRVFVGTTCRDALAEKVLKYSAEKNSTVDIEWTWMRAGDPGWEIGSGEGQWNIGHDAGQMASGRGWFTDFSGFRFAIPELCAFEGRAVYLDVDMIVTGDMRDLLEMPLTHPWTSMTRGRTEPAIIDCAEFLAPELKAWPTLAQMKREGLGISNLVHVLRDANAIRWLDRTDWNSLDRVIDGMKLLHFTDVRTQPWHPWPDRINYRPHPFPNAVAMFLNLLSEATSGKLAGGENGNDIVHQADPGEGEQVSAETPADAEHAVPGVAD